MKSQNRQSPHIDTDILCAPSPKSMVNHFGCAQSQNSTKDGRFCLNALVICSLLIDLPHTLYRIHRSFKLYMRTPHVCWIHLYIELNVDALQANEANTIILLSFSQKTRSTFNLYQTYVPIENQRSYEHSRQIQICDLRLL